MSGNLPMGIAGNLPRVRCSAAYPTDAPEKLCFGGKPHEVRPEGPQGAARERIAKGASSPWGLTPLYYRRNLCVIEFKKANNTETLMAQGFKNDVEKLEFLTGEECKFRYAWGVHIIFMVSSKPKGFRGVSMKWYKDGKQFGCAEDASLP